MADFNNIKPQTLLHQPKESFPVGTNGKEPLANTGEDRRDAALIPAASLQEDSLEGSMARLFFNFINQLYFLEQA